ncbi:MAG: hypothetical protein FGM27_01610 [Candidatus Omnitrophica bacterium]|nr:hypothetical protein [Candidatus Omnitrophota bacterium]
MKLNRFQELAVRAKGKNILVSAGAGTGKTRVLVERFLHFVEQGEASVTEILALTFTEKAANEMKQRILDRCSELGMESERRSLESAYISTLHAFAARVLREHPVEAGIDPDFRVIEAEESESLKEQILDSLFEEHCRQGSRFFDLLRNFGDAGLRSGILSVDEAARQAGLKMSEFFVQRAARPALEESEEAARLIAQNLLHLGETQRLEIWEKIRACAPSWNWQAAQDFKSWRSGFSRKKGKKGENYWSGIKEASDHWYALRLEEAAAPLRACFEELAVFFEAAYEAKKRERGLLDFDDLEIGAVRLFSRPTPVHAKLLDRYRRKFKHILIDEFQDTNALQMKLIHCLSAGGNLFFVGDYKQSIYAFRGAEPELFRNKELEHKAEGGEGVFIPLNENFRTSYRILDFVNQFFSSLWGEDAQKAFEPLAASGDHPDPGKAELLVIRQGDKESAASARMREADQLALKILELRGSGQPFGHMAILLQSMTHVALYEQALKHRGIPSYVMAGGGFYHQPEIKDMMSYLAFLENPLADIPLAAALRSPLFQVSDDSLFWIAESAKSSDSGKTSSSPLYGGVSKALESGRLRTEEAAKIRFFQSVTGELLGLKDRLKLTELFDRILERTSYELTLLSDPRGARRYANLRKLMSLARQSEAFEPLPLGAFLASVRRLETQGVRESEAQIETESGGDAVRILTIHRAKGLEFETVFAADIGREKHAPESKTFLSESRRGYEMKILNPLTGELESPAGWLLADSRLEAKDSQERERLLYVAMTRAKKRLILSGFFKEPARNGKKEKDKDHAQSWMQVLLGRAWDGLEVIEGVRSGRAEAEKPLAEKLELQKAFGGFDAAVLRERIPGSIRRQMDAEASEILERIKPLEQRSERMLHLPVSAYAAYAKDPHEYWRAYEVGLSEDLEEKPAETALLLPEDSPSPADFGTAMHRALEVLDFRKADAEELDRAAREAFRAFSPEVQSQGRGLLDFFRASDVFKRLAQAKRVHREIPFVLREKHGMIHGVIDVLFQDARGDWHVLDYKTAEGSPEKLAQSGYVTQIRIYAHAVFQLLGRAPASGILYFLKNAWEHRTLFSAEDKFLLENEVGLLQDQMMACSSREIFK